MAAIVNNTTSNYVELPVMTVKAIKEMLFSQEGVNITPILDNLSFVNDDNRDLMSINVALAMKGAVPELPEEYRTRFWISYDGRQYSAVEVDKYFIIDDSVSYAVQTYVYDEETKSFNKASQTTDKSTASLRSFLRDHKYTRIKDVLAECEFRRNNRK